MMRFQRLLAAVCIVVPAGVLVSGGCGILASPVEVPKVIATNLQSLKFDVDIEDTEGRPLDGVVVDVTRYARRVDAISMEQDDQKRDKSRTVDKSFSYSTFGNYAVGVEFSKPGYKSVQNAYFNREGPISEGEPYLPGWSGHPRFDEYVNIKKNPRSRVVMTREPAETQPESSQH